MAGLLGMEDLSPLQLLGLGLMGGTSPNFGQNMAQAMTYAQAQKRGMQNDRMLQMQLDQQKKALEAQEEQKRLAMQFYRPGVNLNPVGRDDEGNAMPAAMSQPGFDLQGYAQAMAQQGDPSMLLKMQPKPEEPFTLKPGEKRFQGGKVVAEVPAEAKEVEPLKIDRGDRIDFLDRKTLKVIASMPKGAAPQAPERPAKPQLYDGPSGPVWISPDGSSRAVSGPDGQPLGPKPRAPTEGENVSAGYASRMQSAEGVIDRIGTAGAPSFKTVAAPVVAANLPLIGTKNPAHLRMAERGAMTPEQQQYRQAQEDWVRAKLRKESGAVIADDEMQREIETYFPQYFDGAEVIAQKAAARKTAIAAMRKASGSAANKLEDPLGIRR